MRAGRLRVRFHGLGGGALAETARLLACGLGFAWVLSAAGAEPVGGGELETYLKRLGYHPVAYKRSEENRALLNAELRGKKLIFLIDTGAPTTLKPGCVPGLKTVGESGGVLEDKVFGKITNASVILMDKLVIDRAEFYNQPAWSESVKVSFKHEVFSGILGFDFLVRNHCLLDCAANRIYFHNGEPSEHESEALGETLRRSGFGGVDMDPVSHGIPAQANGHRVSLMIDTGASCSVFDISTVRALKLGVLGTRNLFLRGATGSEQTLRLTVVRSLNVGERSWKNVYFGIADLKAVAGEWPFNRKAPVQGMFGADLLDGHGALIDFSTGKVWFRPEKQGRG